MAQPISEKHPISFVSPYLEVIVGSDMVNFTKSYSNIGGAEQVNRMDAYRLWSEELHKEDAFINAEVAGVGYIVLTSLKYIDIPTAHDLDNPTTSRFFQRPTTPPAQDGDVVMVDESQEQEQQDGPEKLAVPLATGLPPPQLALGPYTGSAAGDEVSSSTRASIVPLATGFPPPQLALGPYTGSAASDEVRHTETARVLAEADASLRSMRSVLDGHYSEVSSAAASSDAAAIASVLEEDSASHLTVSEPPTKKPRGEAME